MFNPFGKAKNQDRFACVRCGVRGLCSSETLQISMMRERSRADRSGGVFSLATFEPTETHTTDEMKQLVRVITEQIRFTDIAGWLSDTAVGVILPDTPGDGARVFTQRVLSKLSEKQPPEYRIYTYPDNGDQENGENPIEKLPSTPPVLQDDAEKNEEPDQHCVSSAQFFNDALALKRPLWKRLIDLFVAGTLLVVFSPVMLMVALAIKISSPGPAIYKQIRVGQAARDFYCYKFRSMHLNVDTAVHENYLKHLMETDMPMQKLDKGHDPRVFPVGRFIRASSLDELPQLFNVIKGEMSLIGPRPSIPYEYAQFLPWQRHRIDALPGLTGLWQVSGKNKTTFSQMMRFDNRYASNISFTLDMSIILKTLPVIIGQFLEDRFPRAQKKSTSED